MNERLLSGSIVLLCGFLCGRAMTSGAKRRKRLLRQLLEAIQLLQIRMLDRLEPLSQALSQTELSPFLEISREMHGGVSVHEAWQRVSERLSARGRPLDCLSQQDLALLTELFSALGESGTNEQRLLLHTACDGLKHALQDADSRFAQACQLYPTLGFLSSLALVVLLI